MTQSSHKTGFIITTALRSVQQYGVAQAPFGLTSIIRGACVARGSFAGNIPYEIPDCGTPAPAPPAPGNDDLDLGSAEVSEHAPGPELAGGPAELNLGSAEVSEHAPGPEVIGGPLEINLGSAEVGEHAPGPDIDAP